MQLISGKVLADQIYDRIRTHLKVNRIRAKICLGIIQVGDDERSNRYIRVKQRQLEALGWDCVHRKLHESISNVDFSNIIYQLAIDDLIHGIIVQLPIPHHLDQTLLNDIPNDKDVDGLTLVNQGMLFKGYDPSHYIAPCTALGCMHFLDAHNLQMRGVRAAVFGRSCLVGRPIAMLLQHRGASVVVLHQEDQSQAILSCQCDILVSAMGVPHYITTEYVKPGAFVVDIGISRRDGQMLGDVHPSVAEHACAVSPTIGGIGPLTVAFLMYNLLKCFCLQNGEKRLVLS